MTGFELMPEAAEYFSGELQGVASATQLPNRPCRMVMINANGANTGYIYIGAASTVTASDGTTDTTTGLQLKGGASTGWIPCENLSQFYRICSSTSEHATYLALL